MRLVLAPTHLPAAAPVSARTMPRAARLGAPLLALLLVIGATALWDQRRQAEVGLEVFGAEQAQLARSAAATLQARLETLDARASALGASAALPAQDASGLTVVEGDGRADPRVVNRAVALPGGRRGTAAVPLAELVAPLARLEQPGQLRLFVQLPGRGELLSMDDRLTFAPALQAALSRGAPSWQVDRAEAAALGLPARVAMAGSSTLEASGTPPWAVVAVATASRERDRAARGALRLVLGFSLVVALVALVLGLARRARTQELESARQLALAEAARVRDERLARAERLATLGVLGPGIAEQIEAPLGLIVALSEQLLPPLANQPGHHAVLTILEQCARLGQVTRSYLGLARAEVTRELTAPAALARSAVDLVSHRFGRAGVRLTLRADEQLPRIACEPDLLEQALVNLLLDACAACARGGQVELVVTGDRHQVGFTVLDDGRPIEAGDLATGPAAYRQDFALSLTREIVRRHRGEFSVNTRKSGLDTRAVIELDAARDPEPAST